MALQYGTTLRNNQLDQITSTAGASAKLRIYTGSPPADCGTAASGSLLATISLPATYMNAASSGSKTLTGSWTVAASGTGTAGYFRLWDSGITTCHVQGTVGQGSGDLSVDNTSIVSGQTVTVTTFTVAAANA